MALSISQEDLDFLKKTVENAEPYSEAEFEQMAYFDGESHIGDQRYAATSALRVLLNLGFSESDVNPWKNKR